MDFFSIELGVMNFFSLLQNGYSVRYYMVYFGTVQYSLQVQSNKLRLTNNLSLCTYRTYISELSRIESLLQFCRTVEMYQSTTYQSIITQESSQEYEKIIRTHNLFSTCQYVLQLRINSVHNYCPIGILQKRKVASRLP